MYKKVKFEFKFENYKEVRVIKTVLTEGYAFKSIVEEMLGKTDGTFTFIVNRNDLSDLRHDVEILIKAGYVVREIEAL